MTRDEALASLSSGVPSDRLTAARFLQFWAVPADIPTLRETIARESVGWVRRALEAALQRLGDKRNVSVDLDELAQDELESSADLAAIARARIARTVVHELEPIVGAVQYYAATEFPGYSTSKTRMQVERLGALLRAVETLGKISTQPRLEQIDLGKLLREVVESEREAFDVDIRLEGAPALLVLADPSLVRLIVGNGLKNSCESVRGVADREGTVVVIYGATDREVWITVSDTGLGLPSGSSHTLFEMGTSTKEDHLGMGLALSSEAARALGGTLILTTKSGGTSLEFVFPLSRSNGASVSD